MATARNKASTRARDLGEVRSRIRTRRMAGHSYVALLGFHTYDPFELIAQVQKGFPYSTFVRFQRNSCLSFAKLADLTQIPSRTLTRRKERGTLEPEESDRLLRVSRVFGRAMELFEGDDDAARAWLFKGVPALGGRVPMDLAKSDVGAREVEDLIGRLEHGIPS